MPITNVQQHEGMKVPKSINVSVSTDGESYSRGWEDSRSDCQTEQSTYLGQTASEWGDWVIAYLPLALILIVACFIGRRRYKKHQSLYDLSLSRQKDSLDGQKQLLEIQKEYMARGARAEQRQEEMLAVLKQISQKLDK